MESECFGLADIQTELHTHQLYALAIFGGEYTVKLQII
jgi:hypothetical protein